MELKEVCDYICTEAEDRFTYTKYLIAKLFYKENFETFSRELPMREINEVCTAYLFLLKEKLKTELQIFYSSKEFHSFKGLIALLNILNEENLESVFTNIIQLIKILVTLPMTTSGPERCFSTLKRVIIFKKHHGSRKINSPLHDFN